jgi:hypothetical protein
MVATDRYTYAEMSRAALLGGFITPALIAIGPTTVETAMQILGDRGFHGAQEQAEGAVWRVERNGAVDFLVKYVRTDKIDGCYLKNSTGEQTEHWMWSPETRLAG